MKILLHACCGPCTLYPYDFLKSQFDEIMIYFYNPYIQPYLEFKKRKETFEEYFNKIGAKIIINENYLLNEFIQKTAFREEKRCFICYYDRLVSAVKVAKNGNFDYFTTTLLYSKMQKHEDIKSICESLEKEYNVKFFYEDFRKGWKIGIEKSKEIGMYRQQYCGCIYSEKERYLQKIK